MDKIKCVCNKIEEIDNIIMAQRFSMCISCACQCKGESFDDLFESSNYCHEQRHRIIHNTTRLHINGIFSSAVDYINACRMFSQQHYIDAKYYLEDAILKSCARENKLNNFVYQNSKVLLSKIKEREDKSEFQFPCILTLSEILAKSENFTIDNKKCKTYIGPIIDHMNKLDKKQITKDYKKKNMKK